MKAFADACNYANQVVKPSILSKRTIQSLVYDQIREHFGLSANLAVRVCARVGANRKTAKVKGKPVKAFSPTSADYDARIFAFREKDWSASLTLNGGREHIKLQVANYQMGKLKGRTPTSAQLCKHRDGLYYLHNNNADLLIMGAYGHSRIRHLVIGSTTAQLLRSSHIPVFLFR